MTHWKWSFDQILFYCRRVAEGVDGLGFGSLTIWNMRTWKTMVSALTSLTNMSWKGMDPWISSYYAYFWFVPPPSVCLRLSKLIDYGLQSVLPLGEDPPVMTSVCFNHNGKILASGATDGMIRLFGITLYNLKFSVWMATRYKKKREEMTLPLIMMWQLVYLYM